MQFKSNVECNVSSVTRYVASGAWSTLDDIIRCARAETKQLTSQIRLAEIRFAKVGFGGVGFGHDYQRKGNVKNRDK